MSSPRPCYSPMLQPTPLPCLSALGTFFFSSSCKFAPRLARPTIDHSGLDHYPSKSPPLPGGATFSPRRFSSFGDFFKFFTGISPPSLLPFRGAVPGALRRRSSSPKSTKAPWCLRCVPQPLLQPLTVLADSLPLVSSPPLFLACPHHSLLFMVFGWRKPHFLQ